MLAYVPMLRWSKTNLAAATILAAVLAAFATPQSRAEPSKIVSASEVAISIPAADFDPSLPPARDTIDLTRQSPESTNWLNSNVLQLDFGRVAFGNIELTPPPEFSGKLQVRFGEKLAGDDIDRDPPGTVRYREVEVEISSGETIVVAPKADERNTQQSGKTGRQGNSTPPAVLTPSEWDVIVPFRWVEIEGLPSEANCKVVRRAALPKHWDDNASDFECSDETLNRIWNLCKYSIKATLFAGVYVDGDRERIPYEADAYLNQLSHYYVESDPRVARETFDWLMRYPTWPTEWGPHMVFMAHADWKHYGDADWIAERYEGLKSKTLMDRCSETGLVHSSPKQIEWNDIIDWPPAERDGYVRSEVNTVVNAFHLAAIEKMAELAEVAGNDADAKRYREHAEQHKRLFYQAFFNPSKGLFRDGLGVDHYSQHANFFPLAFGLVAEQDQQKISSWLVERGMRCSVYAAQYLLESLFENGAGEAAVGLITAPGERSWRHMVESDATITWEAWSESVKPNLDWNHAWGAAPANILPRYVLGAEPLAPGWQRAKIRPNPSGLEFARGIVPTRHGPVSIKWNQADSFRLELGLPENVVASVHVPGEQDSERVLVNGEPAKAQLVDGYWVLEEDVTGESVIEVR